MTHSISKTASQFYFSLERGDSASNPNCIKFAQWILIYFTKSLYKVSLFLEKYDIFAFTGFSLLSNNLLLTSEHSYLKGKLILKKIIIAATLQYSFDVLKVFYYHIFLFYVILCGTFFFSFLNFALKKDFKLD